MAEHFCANCATLLGSLPLYEPLSIESYDVRMLTLVPSTSTIRIECTLKKHSLVFNPPNYVALSYCWGDEQVRKDITINGQVVSVTANLEGALWDLYQRTGDDTIVWADALCINQADKQERSLQVRLMTQIYEKCDMVYAWLGDSNSTVPWPGIFGSLWDTDTGSWMLPTDPALSSACTSMLLILSCPLWQRRWIIQELTTASEIEILYGTFHLSWKTLEQVYQTCSGSAFWLQEHATAARPYRKISEFRTKFQSGQTLSLCNAILETREYLSKDSRDHVYALLGITSDGPALVPTPNYFQDANKVSEGLTRAILNVRRNLDIILDGPKTSLPGSSLPTWSPNWCSPGLSSTLLESEPRAGLDPRCSVSLSRSQRNDGVLRVHGVTIGVVIRSTSSFNCHVSSQHADTFGEHVACHRSCRQYYHTWGKAGLVFRSILVSPRRLFEIWGVPGRRIFFCFKTWISLRLPEPAKADPYSRCVMWMQQNKTLLWNHIRVSPSKTLIYEPLIGGLLLPLVCTLLWIGIHAVVIYFAVSTEPLVWLVIALATEVIILTFVELFKSLNSSQRLCILDNGIICCVCKESLQGDLVCLLEGCSKAVVFRKHTDNELLRYMLVGEAEVYLNKADIQKYKALLAPKDSYISPRWVWKGFLPAYRSVRVKTSYMELLDLYKKQDWWTTYDLA